MNVSDFPGHLFLSFYAAGGEYLGVNVRVGRPQSGGVGGLRNDLSILGLEFSRLFFNVPQKKIERSSHTSPNDIENAIFQLLSSMGLVCGTVDLGICTDKCSELCSVSL